MQSLSNDLGRGFEPSTAVNQTDGQDEGGHVPKKRLPKAHSKRPLQGLFDLFAIKITAGPQNAS